MRKIAKKNKNKKNNKHKKVKHKQIDEWIDQRDGDSK